MEKIIVKEKTHLNICTAWDMLSDYAKRQIQEDYIERERFINQFEGAY